MSLLEILLIAIGLAMDCFAVSIASSISLKRFDWPKMLRMALMFGLFQGVMPLITFCTGVSFAAYMSKVDHWMALIILGYIGIKMIIESLQKNSECVKSNPILSFRTLLGLSVATSIDALATGIVFVPFQHIIVWAVALIALTSFLFTILGCIIGVRFGNRFHLNVELIGGVILVAIGLKIFLEHMLGS